MNRAERRAAKKLQKKNKRLSKKLGLFDEIPDACLTCLKPFDKTDKQMVSTWSVVVREKKKTVRLYCPECWSLAMEVAEATIRK